MDGWSAAHAVGMAALVPWCAAVHRLRGGGYVRMPVKGTYVLWPLVGAAAWLAGASPALACVWAVGYLLWTLPGWMREVTDAEGAAVPGGQTIGSGWDVGLVEFLAGYNAVLAVYVRAALYLAPLALGLSLYAMRAGEPAAPAWSLLLIVFGFWPAYRLGWMWSPNDQSSVAEPAVGACWGLAVLVSLALGLA